MCSLCCCFDRCPVHHCENHNRITCISILLIMLTFCSMKLSLVELNETDDKCLETVRSVYDCLTSSETEILLIEASTSKTFSVNVSAEEKDSLVLECELCYGYTANHIRCKNRRKGMDNKKVWCYHHKTQEYEYNKFQSFGDRPEFCDWWK